MWIHLTKVRKVTRFGYAMPELVDRLIAMDTIKQLEFGDRTTTIKSRDGTVDVYTMDDGAPYKLRDAIVAGAAARVISFDGGNDIHVINHGHSEGPCQNVHVGNSEAY